MSVSNVTTVELLRRETELPPKGGIEQWALGSLEVLVNGNKASSEEVEQLADSLRAAAEVLIEQEATP